VMDALDTYYGAFLAPASIAYESRHPATGHTFPTLDYGELCALSASPWIGNCSYDGAGTGLAQIYGALSAPSSSPTGTFLELGQGDFISDPASHSLADTAYVYVPSSCSSGEPCRMHVAFHGCSQEATGAVGDAFYTNAGYNRWADTNHLVVVYPQTIATMPNNPDACWDWWGYDSPDYAKKTGPQMAMVRAMLEYLASPVGAGG
jgi:Esterase PHB depolymerase